VYNEDVYLIGIGIPKVSLLFHLFRKDGIKIEKIPVDASQAVQFLERRIK
jgi:hypothetical protein